MAKTAWKYFTNRLRQSTKLSLWEDFVVALIGVIIGYRVLERRAAWENLVALLVIGMGATFIFEITKTVWRFVWTVPRNTDRELENALDRLTPRFAVSGVILQTTQTTNQITGQPTGRSVWGQLRLRCLTDAPIEECAGHLREVRRWSSESQEWEETEMNESLRLGWSNGDAIHSPITLEPENERRLNMFYIHSSRHIIIPTVYPLPVRWERVFDFDETLRFDITVRGKGCAPVNVLVQVRRGDPWDHPVVILLTSADRMPRQ
jgi:hypothetical protein